MFRRLPAALVVAAVLLGALSSAQAARRGDDPRTAPSLGESPRDVVFYHNEPADTEPPGL
jgi:hypothetical protein